MTTLHLCLGERGYDINIGRGLLARVAELFRLDRRVFIVTDDGVPKDYAEKVLAACADGKIVTVKQGEGAKSPEVFAYLLEEMLNFGMTRTDCVVAVGGGVVGDLAGFAAASYMRGVDFYNVPTTLLSQVDSSIGGKTAINLGGVKNIVGAFYQPKSVLVDLDTLKTLPKRQVSNGMAEAVKMALTSNRELFEILEKEKISDEIIEKTVVESLKIKKAVVESDEREGGIRKILNFGHTFGHAVEAECEMQGMYHGECVAIGMLVTSSDEVRARLVPILKRLELPTCYTGNLDTALSFISHDKKCEGGYLSVVLVDTPGDCRIERLTVDEFKNLVRERLTK